MSEQKSFEQTFSDIFGKAHEVIVERQRKYGAKNIGHHGLLGIAVRLGDKLARLDRYAIEGHVEEMSDESIEDTLVDIMNYAAIAIAWLHKDWTPEGCPPLFENMKKDSWDELAKRGIVGSKEPLIITHYSYPFTEIVEEVSNGNM